VALLVPTVALQPPVASVIAAAVAHTRARAQSIAVAAVRQCVRQGAELQLVTGDLSNGGLALKDGHCANRCSASYGGTRYCGAGDTYAGDGSIDCSNCWKSGTALVKAAKPVAMSTWREKAAPAAEKPTFKVQSAARHSDGSVCRDDESWMDELGNDCTVYRRTLPKWGKAHLCDEHLGGVGGVFCRETCGKCINLKTPGKGAKAAAPICADNDCIGPWQEATGRCYQCADFAKGCRMPKYRAVFESECPVTCNICKPENTKAVDRQANGSEKPAASTPEVSCENEDDAYCQRLGKAYCPDDVFAKKCLSMCDLCVPAGATVEACRDQFAPFTCKRYHSYGWCDRVDTKDSTRLRCAKTCGQCGQKYTKNTQRIHVGTVKHNSAATRLQSRSTIGLVFAVSLVLLALAAAA